MEEFRPPAHEEEAEEGYSGQEMRKEAALADYHRQEERWEW